MIERELEGKWGVEKLKTEGRGKRRWKMEGQRGGAGETALCGGRAKEGKRVRGGEGGQVD